MAKLHIAHARYDEPGKRDIRAIVADGLRIHTICNEYVPGKRIAPTAKATCKPCLRHVR